jgi:hypothetical protein
VGDGAKLQPRLMIPLRVGLEKATEVEITKVYVTMMSSEEIPAGVKHIFIINCKSEIRNKERLQRELSQFRLELKLIMMSLITFKLRFEGYPTR